MAQFVELRPQDSDLVVLDGFVVRFQRLVGRPCAHHT